MRVKVKDYKKVEVNGKEYPCDWVQTGMKPVYSEDGKVLFSQYADPKYSVNGQLYDIHSVKVLPGQHDEIGHGVLVGQPHYEHYIDVNPGDFA